MDYKYFIFLLLSVLVVSSCQMFHPLNTDIPLLEQKGDLHVDAGFSFTPLMDGHGLSGTLSYAPIDHLALQCAGSYSASSDNPVDEGENTIEPYWENDGYHFQFAAGTFQHVGRGIFEVYLGFARGNVFHGHGYSVLQNTNLYYGQFNYGWNHLCNDKIDVGLGFKVGALSPHWTWVDYVGNEQQPQTHHYDDVSALFEPQAVFRVGGPHLKFCLNLALVRVSRLGGGGNRSDYQPLSIEMGLHYKF